MTRESVGSLRAALLGLIWWRFCPVQATINTGMSEVRPDLYSRFGIVPNGLLLEQRSGVRALFKRDHYPVDHVEYAHSKFSFPAPTSK